MLRPSCCSFGMASLYDPLCYTLYNGGLCFDLEYRDEFFERCFFVGGWCNEKLWRRRRRETNPPHSFMCNFGRRLMGNHEAFGVIRCSCFSAVDVGAILLSTVPSWGGVLRQTIVLNGYVKCLAVRRVSGVI